MSYVALRLAKRSALEMVSFGFYVHDNILENLVTFPASPVDMKDLKTHVEDLLKAEVATQSKTPASYTLRDQKRSVLELDLNQIANYVDEVSGGDVLIIQLAGMEARKQPQKLTELEDPMMLQVDNAVTQKLVLKCSKVDRAVNYVFEYCEELGSGAWQNGKSSTTTKATLTGLTTGKEYWVRVRALGTNGVQSEWSDPIAKVVS